MDGANFVGRHLILDAKVKEIRTISDVHYIYSFLEALSSVLRMTLVYPPIVARFPWASSELEKFTKELKAEGVNNGVIDKMDDLIAKRNSNLAGISGISVWLESHCAIHTWTEESFLSLDAYSCKDFDVPHALGFILKYFGVDNYNGIDIVRTLHEPQVITKLAG